MRSIASERGRGRGGRDGGRREMEGGTAKESERQREWDRRRREGRREREMERC